MDLVHIKILLCRLCLLPIFLKLYIFLNFLIMNIELVGGRIKMLLSAST